MVHAPFPPAFPAVPEQPGCAILGFTTHDQDILFDADNGDGPILYQAATGMANTAQEAGSDLTIDNLEIAAFLESDSITETDIRAGVYDNAEVTLRVVNWADLSQGCVTLLRGHIGNIRMRNGLLVAEFRGLGQKLSTVIGSTYGELCRADLGSNAQNSTSHWLCNVDLSQYRQQGFVVEAPDNRTIVPLGGMSPGSPLLQVGGTGFYSLTASPTIAAQVHRQNDWVNPANAEGVAAWAGATLYGSNDGVNKSSLLQLTGFNFSALPYDAVPVGFVVTLFHQQTAGTSGVYDDDIELIGLGAPSINLAPPYPQGQWRGFAQQVTYGDPHEMWVDVPVSLAQVQASGFGVQLGAECTLGPGNGADIELNGVAITVYYTSATAPPAPAGWFNDGIITFTSGALECATAEIKNWDGTTLTLFLSLPVLPAAGDTFIIEPGCNKGSDCQAKFNNIVNKRAEPFIPGMDQLLDYAG
jgi:uncharacterized phage protein (TIGR02218 family)